MTGLLHHDSKTILYLPRNLSKRFCVIPDPSLINNPQSDVNGELLVIQNTSRADVVQGEGGPGGLFTHR